MAVMLDVPAALPRLWARFHAGKFSRQEIGRSRVLQRWQRSQESGLSPDSPGEPVMRLEGLAAALEQFAPFLAPGAPFDAFASEMARAGFCGLLCDHNGMIFAQRIAEPFRATSARTSLVEGAVWSEHTRGTNGLGTALVEGTPVSIVGLEHFELRNRVLACFAAPIRDVRSRIVAVLDASGPIGVASPSVQASVSATAAALEALIVSRTYDAALAGGLFGLEHLLERLPHAALLVEATGHVRRTGPRYRGLWPADETAALARMVRDHLAAGRDAGRLESELAERMHGYRIEVEPLGLEADPFAALVHLHPHRSPAGSPGGTAKGSRAIVGLYGSDPAIEAARHKAERFAATDLPVLVVGESGTGKETLARAMHTAGRPAGAEFVVIDCGDAEGASRLAGWIGPRSAGSWGMAPAARTGRPGATPGTTLYLDGVCQLGAQAQADLHRYLESGTSARDGSARPRAASVRLVASTRSDLHALVNEGRFRSDLYFRLRGVVLRIPPLRDRIDRSEVATQLLAELCRERRVEVPLGFSRAALEWIEQHPWPGNLRELRTALEHALVLAGDAPRIERWHLPVDEDTGSAPAGDLRAAAERAAVERAMELARGNLSDAARSLGVARSTLYRMLARHGLRVGAGPPKD